MYLLKFIVGSAQIVPDRILFTLDKLNGYKVVFYIPVFLRKRSIQCKLMKVVENDEHEAGHFMISLSSEEMQTETIMTKLSKPCG